MQILRNFFSQHYKESENTNFAITLFIMNHFVLNINCFWKLKYFVIMKHKYYLSFFNNMHHCNINLMATIGILRSQLNKE